MEIAQHTDWERKQLESVELFLKHAIQEIDYFVEKNESLRDADSADEDVADWSADWLKFRGIMLDLYSVLDYVWYLLYCHFSNKGQPDFSDKGCELGFPYKKKGIKSSEKPEHDQKKKFVKDKLKMIWGDKIQFGEGTHFWKEIGATILNVQPKIIVGSSGTPQTGKAEVKPGVEESLALLHYYRNCAAHKDLITFMPKKSLIEINQDTREIRLVTEKKEDNEGYFYMELEKPGFWIQLPSLTSIREPSRLLVDLLHQLRDFVVSTASRLLRSALLVPSPKSILEHHVDGCFLVTESKPSQDKQVVKVRATMRDGTQIEKTALNEEQVYAEEDACIQIIKSLSKAGIVPNSPYSQFTAQYVCPLSPQVQTLERMPDGTYEKLLDDWKKKLEAENMEMVMESLEYNKNILTVRSKPTDAVVFKLYGEVVDGPTTDKATETAASRLINEAVRLGLIEIKQLDWPSNLVQTLTKLGSKTCRMVLNEYKQRVDNKNMIVTMNYDEPRQVEHSCYETKLSLTVTHRDSSDEVFHTSSLKQRGQSKNESKEAAAREVLAKCQKKRIIIINSHEE